MSKWQIQSWEGRSLEIEAESVALHEGSLIFSRMGHPSVALADGAWMTAHCESAVIRTLSGPRILNQVRPLAPVVDIRSKEQA